MRSRPRYRTFGSGHYLTDRERRHFCFGAMTKERFLTKLIPIIGAAAREGIRKPREVSRLLNKENITTATGEPWTPRLTWCLLRLIFEDRNDPDASLWSQKRSAPPFNGKARRHNPADLLVLKIPHEMNVRRKRGQPKKQRLRSTDKVSLRNQQGKTTNVLSLVERTIRKLSSMSTDVTIRVRHNALIQFVSSDDPAYKADIRRLLNAIASDWRRRQSEADEADGYFRWPSTDAPGGDGSLFAGGWPSEGLLSMMQYSVSREYDLSPALRREILTHIFERHLPPLISRDYMSGWGLPGSPMRLEKMAKSIAAFVRNAKRQPSNKMGNAIGEWETDLRFLHDQYYVGRFRFAWPTTGL